MHLLRKTTLLLGSQQSPIPRPCMEMAVVMLYCGAGRDSTAKVSEYIHMTSFYFIIYITFTSIILDHMCIERKICSWHIFYLYAKMPCGQSIPPPARSSPQYGTAFTCSNHLNL